MRHRLVIFSGLQLLSESGRVNMMQTTEKCQKSLNMIVVFQ